MEDVLRKLSSISSKVTSPALCIGECLLKFETTVAGQLTQAKIAEFDKIFINLLKINNGKIGIPASIRIAQCIMFIHKNEPFSNQNELMKLVFEYNEASIFTVGYIISESNIILSENIDKAQDFLFKTAKKLPYPSICALASLINKGTPLTIDETKKFFTTITKLAASGDESLRLIGLWYMYQIADPKAITKSNFCSVMQDFSKKINDSYYVADTLQYTVANFSLKTLEQMKQKAPIDAAFREAFSIITYVKELADYSFFFFLDFLTPTEINANVDILLQCARSISPKSVYQLMTLFSEKTLSVYFSRVSTESKKAPTVEQFKTMEALQHTQEERHELAALAFQLLQTNTKETDTIGTQFFYKLATTEPEHAELYLKTSTLFLGNPPDSNPNWLNDLHAMALIASSILGAGVLEIDDDVIKRIQTFTKNILRNEKNLNSVPMEAAFNLLTVMPDNLIPKDLAAEQIKKMISFIDDQAGISDFDSEQLKSTSAAFANFLKEHPQTTEAAHLLWLLVSIEFMHFQPTMLAAMQATSKVLEKSNRIPLIAKKLTEYFATFTPSRKHIDSLFKHPMSEQALNLLFLDVVEEEFPLFTYIEENQFISFILKNYPALILALPKANVGSVIDFLLKTGNQLMTHTMLLTLLQNHKLAHIISPEIISTLLKRVNDKSPELLIYVTAECISLVVKNRPECFESVVNGVSKSHGALKCFVYGSLCSNCSPSSDFLGKAMYELDDIATKNESSAKYALYALGLLFESDVTALSQMQTAETQCRLILSLMNSSISYSPTNLVQLAWCFVNLLPVIAPEYLARPELMNLICLIMQGFEQNTLPYTFEIKLFIMRPAYAMIREAVNISVMTFPWQRGCPYVEQLATLGLITDIIRAGDNINDDIIKLVKEAFLLAQRNVSLVPQEFVEAAINRGERIGEIYDIISNILSESVIPGESRIEACANAMICALKGAKHLIQSSCKEGSNIDVGKLVTLIAQTTNSKYNNVTCEAFNILLSLINMESSVVFPALQSCVPRALDDMQNSAFFLSAFIGKYKSVELVKQCFAKLKTSRKNASYFIVLAAAYVASQELGMDDSEIDIEQQTTVHLWGVVKRAMHIWKPNKINWKAATKFRDEFKEEFSNIICAAVIMKKKFSLNVVDEQELLNFLEKEKEADELWRSAAAEKAFNLLR